MEKCYYNKIQVTIKYKNYVQKLLLNLFNIMRYEITKRIKRYI